MALILRTATLVAGSETPVGTGTTGALRCVVIVHGETTRRAAVLKRAIPSEVCEGDFETAAYVAEHRLGMSSLELHGASHIAPFMPKGMQDIGTEMHRAASRFAVAAENASVSNDVRAALAALGDVMQQCVACHATYRLH